MEIIRADVSSTPLRLKKQARWSRAIASEGRAWGRQHVLCFVDARYILAGTSWSSLLSLKYVNARSGRPDYWKGSGLVCPSFRMASGIQGYRSCPVVTMSPSFAVRPQCPKYTKATATPLMREVPLQHGYMGFFALSKNEGL